MTRHVLDVPKLLQLAWKVANGPEIVGDTFAA